MAADEKLVETFAKRLEIYHTKHDEADPFAEDTYSRWDATKYVIEAIELLAIELGIAEELERRVPFIGD